MGTGDCSGCWPIGCCSLSREVSLAWSSIESNVCVTTFGVSVVVFMVAVCIGFAADVDLEDEDDDNDRGRGVIGAEEFDSFRFIACCGIIVEFDGREGFAIAEGFCFPAGNNVDGRDGFAVVPLLVPKVVPW